MEVKTLETKTTRAGKAGQTQEADDEKKTKEKIIDDVLGQETEEKQHEHAKNSRLDSQTEDFRHNPEDTRQESQKHRKQEATKMENIRQKQEKTEEVFPKADFRRNPEEKRQDQNPSKASSSLVWDCGSTLYDSFELNSFKRQLDSAISASSAARTLSMPHLPGRRFQPPTVEAPPPPPPTFGKKPLNKISRSLQKLLKSLFRLPKQHSSATPSPVFKAFHGRDIDQYYVVYDKSGSLTTIPEAAEMDVGPEISSLVRRTASERFTAARVVGISCA